MAEEIYILIYVLLISVWVFIDFLKPIALDQSISELRSCHRYAVADQIRQQAPEVKKYTQSIEISS